MKQKKRIVIALIAAIVIIIPMIFEMPERTLGFFIFVFPVAFFSFFMLLSLLNLENKLYKDISFALVAVVCMAQFYWTYIDSDYLFFKSLSYALVGMGVAATFMLVLDHMIKVYLREEDED